MHRGVRQTFKQSESISQDGMDMAIVVFDKLNNKLQYAGAMNNLILINNNEVVDVIADKKSVGGKQLEEERFFTKHEFDIIEGNVHFYIFTDGYHDQFGGADFKKFLIKRFKEMIISGYQLPKSEQCENMKNVFFDWILGHVQMDDVLVMGVKL